MGVYYIIPYGAMLCIALYHMGTHEHRDNITGTPQDEYMDAREANAFPGGAAGIDGESPT